MENMTNAAIIKYFANCLLNDHEAHSVQGIKNYVECSVPEHPELDYVVKDSETGRYFTDGMYSGALKELVLKSSDIKIVSRGTYQKLINGNADDNYRLRNALAITLQDALDGINKDLNNINIGQTTQETVNTILGMRQLISQIEQKRIDLLSDTEQEESNG